MVSSGACASALIALADVAPQLLSGGYPGAHVPELVLWTAADAGRVSFGWEGVRGAYTWTSLMRMFALGVRGEM